MDYLVTGDLVQHAEQLDELPVNSIIDDQENTGRNTYQKQDDNTWVGIERNAGRGPYGADAFSMGGYMRVRNREGNPPTQPPPPTLRQYQWKFRENALSGTAENGVSMEACRKGLTLLGVWDMEQFPLGPGVVVKHADNYLHLPDGTVATNTQHADPKSQHYTLFVWRHQWQTLLGRNGIGRDLKIVEYPGVPEPPDWWAEVGNADTQQQVLDFKAQAFRVGNQIKSEQAWCGTFEHIMGRVGVSSRSIREAAGGGFGVSNRVGQRDAARLPAGTLLLYRSDDWTDHWAVYQRDDTVDNLARTRRIAGHRNESAAPLSHYQSSMIVLSLPVNGAAPSWMVDQPFVVTMLDHLPSGTTFEYSGVRYVIAPNRMIRRNLAPHTGDHNTLVFTASSITIHSLPEGDAS